MTVHWTRFALDQLMEIADVLGERSIDPARAVVQQGRRPDRALAIDD